MIKEIKYGGFTAQPSDYECQDGDLATVINCVPEDGALKPVMPPAVVVRLNPPDKVEYIHKTSAFTHYIIFNPVTNEVSWMDENEVDSDSKLPTKDATVLRSFGTTAIYNINAIGNTLVVLAEDGMHYFLWKGQTDGYLYLGTQLPELPISFGLQGEMIRTDVFSISFNSIGKNDIWKEFTDVNKTIITDQVLAKVNKFIAEESTNKGRFLFPFLVRYAYRLYDGSLTMHSAPVLMIASSDLAPQVFWEHVTGDGSYTDAKLRVVGVVHKLDYAVLMQSRLDMLNDWSDIVRSVDVFVSKPIYTYDQNGQCTKFAQSSEYDSYCVCKHTNQDSSLYATYPLRYQKNGFNKLYAFTYNPSTLSYPTGRLMIPRRSVDSVKEDIRSSSQFYLLESIKVNQLTTMRTLLNIEEDYLQSLVAREVMTDDYDSHDKLMPKYSFAYNSRLNLTNLKKALYDTYNMGALLCYTDGYVFNWADASPRMTDYTIGYSVYFFIKQDGRDIVVEGESYPLSVYQPYLFLYYPNINAYKAVVVQWNYLGVGFEVTLEQHSFLNGAFFFGGWDNPSKGGTQPFVSSQAERIVDIPNKIYTSEVNNPYYFPVLGINTVGTGTILGISSAVKALSEGQFGQFPLYAFTSEGVWALEVSNTGTYTARQPVTRDVCINPDSITQIDSAVLFATDRGIMLISGSNSQCISDSLDAEVSFSLMDLPHADQILANTSFIAEDVDIMPFKQFITGCKMIYDYTNQRIIVYRPSCRYAYVYSLKSKLWGMTQSTVEDGVNSYPNALAMDENGNLIDFSLSEATGIKGIIVTRPLKLEEPDMLKTIDTVIQRGYFRKGHVQTILYGSRDLFNWFVVFSSTDHCLRGFRGTPYKYFRIALLCNLSKEESISGCSIQLNTRYTNQLR